MCELASKNTKKIRVSPWFIWKTLIYIYVETGTGPERLDWRFCSPSFFSSEIFSPGFFSTAWVWSFSGLSTLEYRVLGLPILALLVLILDLQWSSISAIKNKSVRSGFVCDFRQCVFFNLCHILEPSGSIQIVKWALWVVFCFVRQPSWTLSDLHQP